MLVKSGCKINIGLWVTCKRSDGYHDIESLFVPVPFFDTIEVIEAKASDLITYNADFDIPKEKNLVWKCFLLMQERYDVPNIEIHLVKRIPSGGGIGGGSGNVGAFINAVDRKFDLKLSVFEKEQLAMEIGSDCGFFIENKPALVLGRGEAMIPYHGGYSFYAYLLYSDIQIGTAQAYTGMVPKARGESYLEILKTPEHWQGKLTNDFESVVYGAYPELAENEKALINSGAVYAGLSGTGGCQIALFKERIELPQALQEKVLWEGELCF
jgi:4-diphosphocytidyl-2-C-methyl-D-erythritol kinase